MKGAEYTDLFDMRAERGAVSIEEQLATLRKLGVIIPNELATLCYMS